MTSQTKEDEDGLVFQNVGDVISTVKNVLIDSKYKKFTCGDEGEYFGLVGLL